MDAFRYKKVTVPGRPQLRAFLWVSAVLLGGLGLIVLAYALVAEADLFDALTAVVIALLAVAYMILVLLSLGRSKETGDSRRSDRERRGF